MQLILNEDRDVAIWVAQHIPHMAQFADRLDPLSPGPFGPAVAIGVLDAATNPVAGVVFHGYQAHARNIEVSFASTSSKWLTPALISGIMAYPFTTLKCQRITSLTPKRYTDARRFVEAFGFQREGKVRRGFGFDDMIVSGLLAEEWARNRFNLACPKDQRLPRPPITIRKRKPRFPKT